MAREQLAHVQLEVGAHVAHERELAHQRDQPAALGRRQLGLAKGKLKLDLGQYLMMGRGEEACGGRQYPEVS